MTMPTLPLEPIRQAVNSGEFDRAWLLWNELAAGLEEELHNRSLTAARLAEVNELIAWSRSVVLCDRAHIQDQLNSMHVAGEYELDVPPPSPRLVETSF